MLLNQDSVVRLYNFGNKLNCNFSPSAHFKPVQNGDNMIEKRDDCDDVLYCVVVVTARYETERFATFALC